MALLVSVAGHALVVSADPYSLCSFPKCCSVFRSPVLSGRDHVGCPRPPIYQPARKDHPVDADAGGDAARLAVAMVQTPGALQWHPAFHFCDPADDGACRHRLRVGNELAQGEKSPQLAAGRRRGFSRSACCCHLAK